MEIKGHAYDDRSRDVRRADITRPNRDSIAASNPPLSPPLEIEPQSQDRVEVSETGRQVSEQVREADRPDDRAPAERVRDLERAYRRGELNTPARVEAAAVRLLESH
jgi:hypothetical protein